MKKWKSWNEYMKKITIFFMRSMFLCWAQTLIYCNTPSRIFWSFQHFKICMLIPKDSLSHKGGSKLWPFFTIPFGSPSLFEVHGLDNFFVNINVGIKIGKTKLCSIKIDMSSKKHCYFSKYKTWSFLRFIIFHLSL